MGVKGLNYNFGFSIVFSFLRFWCEENQMRLLVSIGSLLLVNFRSNKVPKYIMVFVVS